MEKLKFKTEKEMMVDRNESINNWKDGDSRDGYVEKASGEFTYNGIKYLIKVLRYFNHTNLFTSMGHRISDCHCVVEYPEETKPLKELVDDIEEYSEFLYHDTNHSHNDNQTTEEQIKECHELAKEDIDRIPKIVLQAKEKIKKLENTMKALTQFGKKDKEVNKDGN